jgi:hypothetical protein
MSLFHWTCNHGRAGIEATGTVEPRLILGLGWLAWFTTEPHPYPERTGLLHVCPGSPTDCYRGAWRFVVEELDKCHSWLQSTEREKAEERAIIDIERLGDPWNWYVASEPVKVRLG